MRALIDTNVWRYLSDAGAGAEIIRKIRSGNHQMVVAPSIVQECSRIPDPATRLKVLHLVCNPRWKRLMPEALLECDEIKSEVNRLRPEWIIAKPNLAEVRRLKHDWIRKNGGFWSRYARGDLPTGPIVVSQDRESEFARQESFEIRGRLMNENQAGGQNKLSQILGIPEPNTPGWMGQPIEYWRLPAMHIAGKSLMEYASPYREWLDSEIDVFAMLGDSESFNRFWLYEATALNMPRQWLRGSFEFMQGWHKVTHGTPADSQIASHLVDVDVVISSDKNLVRFANRCRNEGPIESAKAVLLSAGATGVEELLTLLS